jgi:hypothetical protein
MTFISVSSHVKCAVKANWFIDNDEMSWIVSGKYLPSSGKASSTILQTNVRLANSVKKDCFLPLHTVRIHPAILGENSNNNSTHTVFFEDANIA